MTDRVVLITGGASGIGAAAVAASVPTEAAWRRSTSTATHWRAIDCEYRVTADASDVAAVHAAVAEVAAAMGGHRRRRRERRHLATAGRSRRQRPEDWDLVHGREPRSVYRLAQATLPHLRARRGAIVDSRLAAGAGRRGRRGGLLRVEGRGDSLTRAMAIDHGPEGVRFNCVCPGPTDTPLAAAFFEGSGDAVGTRRAYEALRLHNRLVEPAEIADAIAYLARRPARVDDGRGAGRRWRIHHPVSRQETPPAPHPIACLRDPVQTPDRRGNSPA